MCQSLCEMDTAGTKSVGHPSPSTLWDKLLSLHCPTQAISPDHAFDQLSQTVCLFSSISFPFLKAHFSLALYLRWTFSRVEWWIFLGKQGRKDTADIGRETPRKLTEVSSSLMYLKNFKQLHMTGVDCSRSVMTKIKWWRRKQGLCYYLMKLFGLYFIRRLIRRLNLHLVSLPMSSRKEKKSKTKYKSIFVNFYHFWWQNFKSPSTVLPWIPDGFKLSTCCDRELAVF